MKRVKLTTLEGLRLLLQHLKSLGRGEMTVEQLEREAAQKHGLKPVVKGEEEDNE